MIIIFFIKSLIADPIYLRIALFTNSQLPFISKYHYSSQSKWSNGKFVLNRHCFIRKDTAGIYLNRSLLLWFQRESGNYRVGDPLLKVASLLNLRMLVLWNWCQYWNISLSVSETACFSDSDISPIWSNILDLSPVFIAGVILLMCVYSFSICLTTASGLTYSGLKSMFGSMSDVRLLMNFVPWGVSWSSSITMAMVPALAHMPLSAL